MFLLEVHPYPREHDPFEEGEDGYAKGYDGAENDGEYEEYADDEDQWVRFILRYCLITCNTDTSTFQSVGAIIMDILYHVLHILIEILL